MCHADTHLSTWVAERFPHQELFSSDVERLVKKPRGGLLCKVVNDYKQCKWLTTSVRQANIPFLKMNSRANRRTGAPPRSFPGQIPLRLRSYAMGTLRPKIQEKASSCASFFFALAAAKSASLRMRAGCFMRWSMMEA